MTVRHITRTAVGKFADAPGLPAIRTNLFKTYPDVPLHPLDGPVPTD